MENVKKTPFRIVDETIDSLYRLKGVLFMLACISDISELNVEELKQTMLLLHTLTEEQIKALEGIQWTEWREKAVVA